MGIEINLPAACRAPVYVRGCRTSGRRTSQEVQANHVVGDAGKDEIAIISMKLELKKLNNADY